MTLRARLALGLLTIAAVLVLPLWLTLHSLDSLQAGMAELRRVEFSASLTLGRVRAATDELRRSEIAAVVVLDTVDAGRLPRAVDSLHAAVDSLRAIWPAAATREIAVLVDDVAKIAPVELALVSERKIAQADTLRRDAMLPSLDKLEAAIAEAERTLRLQTEARVGETDEQTQKAIEFAYTSALVALLLATLIAIWLTRTISRPVRDLERGMEAVANGEFGHALRIAPNRHDEFGRLAASYHSMATQLAELDKLKAEFVSIASHELKTPLNVILGYLSLLDDGIYGDLTPRQREVLATIESQCQALSRLVKQLLDVSRFEAGGGKLEPRPIDLAAFLDELEDAFQVLARQRGVEFAVALSPDLPTQVVWDPDRISEVLGNLLSNAFKFTNRFGQVELFVEPMRNGVSMEVRDTGAGIAAAQLPHIFEKFYQADNQTEASAKGTGLGLAIAKEIVDAHQGTITVDSTLGVGTTFTITLPTRVVPTRRSASARLVAEGAA